MKVKKKRRLNFIDHFFLWISILLSAALLISYLAPVTDPRKLWVVAFFGLAYPFLLLANGILIIYWILRRSKYILIPLVTISVGWPVLSNSIGFNFSKKQVGLKTDSSIIRVMTYNVHEFKRYGAKNDISTKHEILEIINREQPDVIGFQEFYTKRRGQYAMRDSLKQVLKSAYCYFEPFSYSRTIDALGMAIFSKYPIQGQGVIMLSEPGSLNQCLYVDIKKNNHTFRLYSIHLQSIHFDPEDYQYLDSVSKQGKTDMNSSKRIGWKLKRAFLKRSEQVLKVKNHAAQCPYPYIIAGDFNDTPSSFAVHQMSKGLKNAFSEKGRGIGRTYNGDFPNYQIDYIMTSQQFDIINYQVIEKKLSDHYPVYSDLVLK